MKENEEGRGERVMVYVWDMVHRRPSMVKGSEGACELSPEWGEEGGMRDLGEECSREGMQHAG